MDDFPMMNFILIAAWTLIIVFLAYKDIRTIRAKMHSKDPC
jgi:hypothetical protein